MSERVLTLDLPGADLPGAGDPVITDIVAGALAVDRSRSARCICSGGRISSGSRPGLSQVLLILVDGLGYELIQEYVGHTPTLRRLRGDIRSIHTVVPSTTAAAITAFGTGARPGATNMVGFSVAYGGGVMNLLAMEGGPAPTEWQPIPTYFERLAAVGVSSAVISPARFAGSGLTGAALRGARHVPAETLDERVSAALRELRAGTPVVYLYWSEIDHAGHGSGVGSDSWIGGLEEFDAGLARLLQVAARGRAHRHDGRSWHDQRRRHADRRRRIHARPARWRAHRRGRNSSGARPRRGRTRRRGRGALARRPGGERLGRLR